MKEPKQSAAPADCGRRSAGSGRADSFYRARGEMENHIKEQMCLFADRLSTNEMRGNQLRLYYPWKDIYDRAFHALRC